jgi:hypothetical protein
MNPEPPPAPVTVRPNRTFGAWLLVIGAAVLLIVLIQDVLFDPRRALTYVLSYACAGFLLHEGVGLLIRTVYFTYVPASEQLVVRSSWGRPRAYPRPGYEWIAYSTRPLRVREVAADGHSRTIPVSPRLADAEDWAIFLDHLHDLSAPDTVDATEDRPDDV